MEEETETKIKYKDLDGWLKAGIMYSLISLGLLVLMIVLGILVSIFGRII